VTYFLDPDALASRASCERERYAAAVPFPHAVLDDLIPGDVLQAVLDEFPPPDEDGWWRFDDVKERKLALHDRSRMGPASRRLFDELNSAPMVDFLGQLTGITGLVPDPHLYGGGLHLILPGGFLEVHADFNRHPLTGLQRRLNLLIYLNRDWSESYGGALELWDAGMAGPPVVVPPVFGRCVLFATTDTSFHGHPHPLACPPGMARRSLALYYYSLPEEQTEWHNTVFRGEAEAAAGSNGDPERSWRDAVPGPLRTAARRLLRR